MPVACSFELRTSECSLTEVVRTDANGAPIYAAAAEAQAFQAAIEKYMFPFPLEKIDQIMLGLQILKMSTASIAKIYQ